MNAMTIEASRFTPSIAQTVGYNSGQTQVSAALWAALIFALPASGALPSPFLPDALSHQGEVYGAVRAAQTDQTILTAQDLVVQLKAKGMPISGLSEVLHVERKTIYSWLDDGVEANDSNYQRLRDVFGLFEAEEDGSLRFFHRLWQRKLPDGSTLKDQLTAVHLNKDALARALDVLRPAVSRAMKVDTQRKIGSTVPHAAASLTLNLQVSA